MKDKIRELCLNRQISSNIVQYTCSHADDICLIFAETSGTRKVMIPTDVVVEWISAYESRLISITMTAREMRQIMTKNSVWAPYQHGFETHLKAIVTKWAIHSSE